MGSQMQQFQEWQVFLLLNSILALIRVAQLPHACAVQHRVRTARVEHSIQARAIARCSDVECE